MNSSGAANSSRYLTSDESESSAAAAETRLCIVNGESSVCAYSTNAIIQTIFSYFSPTSNVCGYTTEPSAATSSTSSTLTATETGYIYTVTDPNFGWVIEGTSVTVQDIAGFAITECAAGITTASTVSSIAAAASAYGASVGSASSASASSASAASAAAATPTSRVLITYYTYEYEEVSLYQYRTYDGGSPSHYCWSASPISR